MDERLEKTLARVDAKDLRDVQRALNKRKGPRASTDGDGDGAGPTATPKSKGKAEPRATNTPRPKNTPRPRPTFPRSAAWVRRNPVRVLPI